MRKHIGSIHPHLVRLKSDLCSACRYNKSSSTRRCKKVMLSDIALIRLVDPMPAYSILYRFDYVTSTLNIVRCGWPNANWSKTLNSDVVT